MAYFIFTHIWLIFFLAHAGRYAIHGWYGIPFWLGHFFSELGNRQLPLPDPMKLLRQALVVACLDGFVLGTRWLTTPTHRMQSSPPGLWTNFRIGNFKLNICDCDPGVVDGRVFQSPLLGAPASSPWMTHVWANQGSQGKPSIGLSFLHPTNLITSNPPAKSSNSFSPPLKNLMEEQQRTMVAGLSVLKWWPVQGLSGKYSISFLGRQATNKKRSQAMRQQHSSLYLDGAHNLCLMVMMDSNQPNSWNVSTFPLYQKLVSHRFKGFHGYSCWIWIINKQILYRHCIDYRL